LGGASFLRMRVSDSAAMSNLAFVSCLAESSQSRFGCRSIQIVGLSEISSRAKELDIDRSFILSSSGGIYLNNIAGGGFRFLSERTMHLTFI
jgi:hypothetical protein